MHAGVGNHEILELRSISHKPRIVIVGRRTSSDAVIATGTTIQIDQHRLGTVDQAFIQQKFLRRGTSFLVLVELSSHRSLLLRRFVQDLGGHCLQLWFCQSGQYVLLDNCLRDSKDVDVANGAQ